jgi:hypothetical protein
MTLFEDWLIFLENEIPFGMALLLNMFFDCSEERVNLELVNRFGMRINELLSSGDIQQAIDYLGTHANEEYDCAGLEVPINTKKCSRVMSWSVLETRGFKKIPNGRPHSPVNTESEWMWEKLKKEEYVKRNAKSDAFLRGKGQFAWVTQTSYLDSIRGQENFADQVRNKLGLCSISNESYIIINCIQEDDLFVEIKYSENVMREKSIKSPTFLEGCYHPFIYRSYEGSDGWGRAVNIENYGIGFPEAVHNTLKFGEGHTVHRVGRVSKLEQDFDLASFLKLFPYPHTDWGSESRDKLIQYFSNPD